MELSSPRTALVLATAIAFTVTCFSVHRSLIVREAVKVVNPDDDLAREISLPLVHLADLSWPGRWQTGRRHRLRKLLRLTDGPPRDTNELSLARYAEYALQLAPSSSNFEGVMLEGRKRDPRNALYPYLLAHHYLTRALDGPPPEVDKKTGKTTYHYRVKNRKLLDRAMREVAAGLDMPFFSRRGELLRARLATMPPPETFESRFLQIGVMARIKFPEYSKLRHLVRVNGFYLNLLFTEGRRSEAKPFLSTGETLALQVTRDDPPTLTGMLVALALHAISERSDAWVCRQFGMDREADRLCHRYTTTMKRLAAWKRNASQSNQGNAWLEYCRKYAGVFGAILLPVLGRQESLTPESLRPCRLLDYVMIEGFASAVLGSVFLTLLGYSGLIALRWRLVSRDGPTPDARLSFTQDEWLRVWTLGLAWPLGLYVLCSTVPVLSGRSHCIVSSCFLFFPAIAAFVLWLLIVPESLAAKALRQHSVAAGLTDPSDHTLGKRCWSALKTVLWVHVAGGPVLGSVCWVLLSVLYPSLYPFGLVILCCVAMGVAMVVLTTIPGRQERRNLHLACYRLAHLHTTSRVYAVLAVVCAGLYVACLARERHLLRIDTVMGPMNTKEVVAFTSAEGKVVLRLQRWVLEDNRKLPVIEHLEGRLSPGR